MNGRFVIFFLIVSSLCFLILHASEKNQLLGSEQTSCLLDSFNKETSIKEIGKRFPYVGRVSYGGYRYTLSGLVAFFVLPVFLYNVRNLSVVGQSLAQAVQALKNSGIKFVWVVQTASVCCVLLGMLYLWTKVRRYSQEISDLKCLVEHQGNRLTQNISTMQSSVERMKSEVKEGVNGIRVEVREIKEQMNDRFADMEQQIDTRFEQMLKDLTEQKRILEKLEKLEGEQHEGTLQEFKKLNDSIYAAQEQVQQGALARQQHATTVNSQLVQITGQLSMLTNSIDTSAKRQLTITD